MSEKYTITDQFDRGEPIAAEFFCTVSEVEFTPEFRLRLFDGWRDRGVQQVRVTIVNDDYPNPPYPHGIWIEGWRDIIALMLPFGAARPDDGTTSPPLVAA